MSDDVWRRKFDDDDNLGADGEFGPPLFADDPTGQVPAADPSGATGGISFGNDTGPLPHWTEPPTGELPNTQSMPVTADPTDDLDVWSAFSNAAPVWSDDPAPTAQTAQPVVAATGSQTTVPPTLAYAGDETLDDISVAPRREPSRITIGTDPTDDRMGRPVPRGRARGGADPSRGAPRGARPTVPPRAPSGGTGGRDMPTAIAVGVLLAAAFVITLMVKPFLVLIVIVAVIALAAVEFFDKVTEKGYKPATVAGIVACTAAPVATYWVGETAIPLVVVLALAAGCATFITSNGLESNPMPNMAITMLGVAWIGIAGGFGALILSASTVNSFTRHWGTDTLFLLALGVVANDVGALFIGSAAGRTPLRPWISPNKTLEGFVGGSVMTILAMVVVGVSGKSDTWHSTKDLVLLGIVVAVTAPLGDLTESMFKRNLDVKDFGSIIKGHGGVLDRFDGFLFTLPAVYYLMRILEPWTHR